MSYAPEEEDEEEEGKKLHVPSVDLAAWPALIFAQKFSIVSSCVVVGGSG